VPMPDAREKFNAQLKDDLRKSHFHIGIDPNDWRTTIQEEFNNKGNPMEIRGKLAEDIKKDLRQSHFHIGTSDRLLKTTHQNDFVQFRSKPTKMDPLLAKDLRSHHAVLGIDGKQLQSSYKSDFCDQFKGQEGKMLYLDQL
jgi:hypothetical protein